MTHPIKTIIPSHKVVDIANVLSIGVSRQHSSDYDAMLYYINFKMADGFGVSKRYLDKVRRDNHFSQAASEFKAAYPNRPVSHKE